MNKWKRWAFWKWVKELAESKMKSAWMQGGNCDSCCPTCKQWESKGNTISTFDREDDSFVRVCSNCDKSWRAIFTPAGFVSMTAPQESSDERN